MLVSVKSKLPPSPIQYFGLQNDSDSVPKSKRRNTQLCSHRTIYCSRDMWPCIEKEKLASVFIWKGQASEIYKHLSHECLYLEKYFVPHPLINQQAQILKSFFFFYWGAGIGGKSSLYWTITTKWWCGCHHLISCWARM